MKYVNILLFLIILFSICSCSSSLENLADLKARIQFYYESGEYNKELTEILNDASDDFSGIKPESKSAVIFDIDETVLSNYEPIKKMGFGYISEYWHNWILEAKAPPIQEVKDFYKMLVSKGFRIIFITGRSRSEYDATYKNLIEAGYTKFDTLIVRSPELNKAPAYNFKSIERMVLSGMGYKIIASVGDQQSDIEGDYTGIKIKLPNYMYTVE